jgi:hypothetical protein
MTEREQKAIEWVIEHCPQELINALAGRVAEVLRADTTEPQALAKNPANKGGAVCIRRGSAANTATVPRSGTSEIVESAQTPAPKSKRFTKPTIEEIRDYCAERGNGVNAESFYNFYEANGWRVGKNPMKDWKACVRTW